MKRSAFKRRELPPRREREAGEFASFKPTPRRAVMASSLGELAPVAIAPKVPGRKSQAIRESARDEECTVRIPGVCTFRSETTIWSHAPLGAAGKGRGLKAIDLAGAYCCTACDAAIDGQRSLPAGVTRDQALLDWFLGHMRSLVILKQKGLA